VCAAGVTHICLQHQDMRELASRFEAAGATFHAAPVALGTGYEYCYIRDTETNVLNWRQSGCPAAAGSLAQPRIDQHA